MLTFVLALVAMALAHGHATGPANGVFAGGAIPPAKRELMADGAVTPGAMLVTSATDGKVSEAGALAKGVVGIAAENDSYLNTSGSYLTDFADGKPVPFYDAPGTQFYGIIKANSAALVFGDLLQCAANGELEKYAPDIDPTSLATVDSSTTAALGTAVARYMDPADFAPGGTATRKLCTFLGGAA